MSKPSVGIIMGSQSDLRIMKEAAEVLEELGIAYELIHCLRSSHATSNDRICNHCQNPWT